MNIHKIKEINPELDEYNLSHIYENNKEKNAVLIVKNFKLNAKHINKLSNEIINNKCQKGTIFYLREEIPSAEIYNFANSSNIEIIDLEDLTHLVNCISTVISKN